MRVIIFPARRTSLSCSGAFTVGCTRTDTSHGYAKPHEEKQVALSDNYVDASNYAENVHHHNRPAGTDRISYNTLTQMAHPSVLWKTAKYHSDRPENTRAVKLRTVGCARYTCCMRELFLGEELVRNRALFSLLCTILSGSKDLRRQATNVHVQSLLSPLQNAPKRRIQSETSAACFASAGATCRDFHASLIAFLLLLLPMAHVTEFRPPPSAAAVVGAVELDTMASTPGSRPCTSSRPIPGAALARPSARGRGWGGLARDVVKCDRRRVLIPALSRGKTTGHRYRSGTVKGNGSDLNQVAKKNKSEKLKRLQSDFQSPPPVT